MITKLFIVGKSSPTYLGIDNIAVLNGHNYLTVIYNQSTGSIIDILHGHTTESVAKEIKEVLK